MSARTDRRTAALAQRSAGIAFGHLSLRGLADRFIDLVSNAQAFMSSLQRTIDLHDMDFDPRQARYRGGRVRPRNIRGSSLTAGLV
jgi:Protein of unknown function (DUF2397)